MLSIKDMFIEANRASPFGVQGYQVAKNYVGGHDKVEVPKSILKKGSYLEEYARDHGYVPGPGVYNYAKELWPQKSRVNRNKIPSKKTYIDEIMDKAKKFKQPGPTTYKLSKSVKQMDAEKKLLERRKTHYQDRDTYLDGVQYKGTQTPGVGKYYTKVRPKSAKILKGDRPEQWRKKHMVQKAKKPLKRPDMGSYNPKQVKSYERKNTRYGDWSRVKRFTSEKRGSGIGPGKYIKMDDWAQRNYASTSKFASKSVYYQ